MTERDHILVYIVDDDSFYAASLKKYLDTELSRIQVECFPTGEACIHAMHNKPDVVILDYFLNTEFKDAWNGIRVLKEINLRYPYTNVIMLSSQENIETVLAAIREGLYEYVVKNEYTFQRIRDMLLIVEENLLDEEDGGFFRGNPDELFSGILVLCSLSCLIPFAVS